MKKTLLGLILLLGVTWFFTITSYGWPGSYVTKTYTEQGFTRLGIASGMKLKVQQGKWYDVKIRASQTAINRIQVKRQGNRLNFSLPSSTFLLNPKIEISVFMPELTGLDAKGGSKAEIAMNLSQNDFTASLSGGSSLKGSLIARGCILDVSGGSRGEFTGQAKTLKIRASGRSPLFLKEFPVEKAELNLSGGSKVEVYVTHVIDVTASSGSQIYYCGRPRLGKTSFSGGSGIHKL